MISRTAVYRPKIPPYPSKCDRGWPCFQIPPWTWAALPFSCPGKCPPAFPSARTGHCAPPRSPPGTAYTLPQPWPALVCNGSFSPHSAGYGAHGTGRSAFQSNRCNKPDGSEMYFPDIRMLPG